MKAGKRLTRRQAMHLQALNLDPRDWLLSKKELYVWVIIHRYTGQSKLIRGEG